MGTNLVCKSISCYSSSTAACEGRPLETHLFSRSASSRDRPLRSVRTLADDSKSSRLPGDALPGGLASRDLDRSVALDRADAASGRNPPRAARGPRLDRRGTLRPRVPPRIISGIDLVRGVLIESTRVGPVRKSPFAARNPEDQRRGDDDQTADDLRSTHADPFVKSRTILGDSWVQDRRIPEDLERLQSFFSPSALDRGST